MKTLLSRASAFLFLALSACTSTVQGGSHRIEAEPDTNDEAGTGEGSSSSSTTVTASSSTGAVAATCDSASCGPAAPECQVDACLDDQTCGRSWADTGSKCSTGVCYQGECHAHMPACFRGGNDGCFFSDDPDYDPCSDSDVADYAMSCGAQDPYTGHQRVGCCSTPTDGFDFYACSYTPGDDGSWCTGTWLAD